MVSLGLLGSVGLFGGMGLLGRMTLSPGFVALESQSSTHRSRTALRSALSMQPRKAAAHRLRKSAALVEWPTSCS